jgi:hypothetical protein
MVFKQYREVVTADAAFRDLDMEIKVTMTVEGKLKFDVTIWNLTESTWNTIENEDIVQIKAGWEDGPVEVLCYGEVQTLNTEIDTNDVKFKIAGVDQSDAAVNSRFNNTWSNTDPGTIAADIATQIGLSPQTVNVGEPIQGNWSVSVDQQAKKWLDDLKEIAQEKTGTEWEWHAEAGELVFQPKSDTYREAPVLSWDDNLISINDASEADSDNEKVSFESMLVPQIQKGSAVDVQTPDYQDIWKVEKYEHQTGDPSGDHLTRGTLIPTEEDYPIESERTLNVDSQSIQSLGF